MRFRENLNVIRARFIIGMKIYFRYPLNFILSLFDPIIWLTPFYFMAKGFSSGGRILGFEYYTGNSDFIGFMVIGYMVTAYMNVALWSIGFSLKEEMRQGVLESNWSTPANRILLMISQSLFRFCVATLEVIITGVVCHFAFGFNITSNILKAVGLLIPGILGLIGIGIGVAALVLAAKEANSIIDISSGLVSAFSGSYFPISVFPKALLFICFMLPVTYLNDGIRGILLNQNTLLSIKYEFIILIALSLFSFALGSFIFMKIEKKCRDLGILGGH